MSGSIGVCSGVSYCLTMPALRVPSSVRAGAHTRWEWVALDMAIMAIGCVTIPVYETNSAAQMRGG